MRKTILKSLCGAMLMTGAAGAWATCADISYDNLKAAVEQAKGAGKATGGYGLDMWATVVDETGLVCWVTTSGATGAAAGNSEWLGSRVISAQKANTANAFSINGYMISTANLYSAVQPGGSLYGLASSNPVNPAVAYAGSPSKYGTKSDPLKGKRVGGINTFGGGLALFKGGVKVGALGVSGDTSCRDHAFAWRVRSALGMQPAAPTVGITTSNMNGAGIVQTPLPGATVGDEMIIGDPNDTAANYWNAWAQPACPNSLPAIALPGNGTLTTLPSN
jgi:uncharacterized protein GlcG (DUF336 family)